MSKLSALKNIGTDRAKVMAWLSHINEFCQEIIDEVIEACVKDPEARKYFVARHDEDVLNIYQPHLHLIARRCITRGQREPLNTIRD